MLLESVQAQIDAFNQQEDQNEGPAFRFENLGLTEIPQILIDALVAYNPSKLSFQNNKLTTLPESLGALTTIYYLDISGNQFSELPLVVCDLPQLGILDISSNRLRQLPQMLESLAQVQVISLKDNALEYVPPVLADLPNLTFVELENNPLIMPPADEPEKNDPEWLTEYIDRHRPTLENLIATTASKGGRKRMGFVMGDEKVAIKSTPTSPTSTSLQPSPIQLAGPHKHHTNSPQPDIVAERLLFALRQLLKGVDGLGRPAFTTIGQAAYTQATARVSDLSNAIESGIKCAPHCCRAIEATLELIKPVQSACVLLCAQSDICAVRALILDVFHGFNELNNAWNALNASQVEEVSNPDLAAADEQLYNQLESATQSSQAVLSLLNETVSRSALASTGPGVPSNSEIFASRVRDVSNACITGFSATSKLRMALDNRNTIGIPDRRRFWEDVNNFLKAIIAILAAAKSAISDLPLLAEVRSQISTLARVAKEIPPLLEQSSYNLSMVETTSPRQPQYPLPPPSLRIGAVGGAPSPTIQPPTPLTASLGAAAQAVMSPGIYQQTPFFHDVRSPPPP